MTGKVATYIAKCAPYIANLSLKRVLGMFDAMLLELVGQAAVLER